MFISICPALHFFSEKIYTKSDLFIIISNYHNNYCERITRLRGYTGIYTQYLASHCQGKLNGSLIILSETRSSSVLNADGAWRTAVQIYYIYPETGSIFPGLRQSGCKGARIIRGTLRGTRLTGPVATVLGYISKVRGA